MTGIAKLSRFALAVVLAASTMCASGFAAAASAGPSRAYAAQLDAGTSREIVGQSAVAYTVPVKMLQLNTDSASMASALMHPTAYAQAKSGGYNVTVYFVNASIMGSTIYSGSLGEATYDKARNGVMVPVDSDVYSKKTQVKAVTMTVASLDEPIIFHLDMFMSNVRLVFDTSKMAKADAEPAFPEVESSAAKFPVDSVAVIGGSADDGANAMTRLPNGKVVIAGDTASTDQSFSDHATAESEAYISVCEADGEVLSTSYLTGPRSVCVYSLSSADSSAFFACGYFVASKSVTTGAFKAKVKAGTEGKRNGFVAKYDANNQLQWVQSVCNSQACQLVGVEATSDGGCVAVAEVFRGTSASDYAKELTSLVNTLVVKYDAQGNEVWHTVVTGGSSAVVDTDGAIAETAQGHYLLAGCFSPASEGTMLGGLERFGADGNTFDIYMIELDEQGKVVAARSYGGSAANETAECIEATSDGGFIMAGDTLSKDGTFASSPAAAKASNGYVMKCDAGGNVTWIDTHKATQATGALGVVETSDGYAVLGSGEGKDGDFTELAKGQADVYVALYDKEGHRSSLRTFGGSKKESTAAIAAAEGGQYLLFVDSKSSDVDMEGLARGKSDAVLISSSKSAEANAQKVLDAEAAAIVEGLISALPEPSKATEADADAVAAARAEFDALNAEATALVSAASIARLQAVEKALAQLPIDKAAAEKEAAEKKAADAKAKKVKTVTVNVATVNAKAVKAAIAKKGGKPAYVTKIVLGSKVKTVSAGAFAGMGKLGEVTLGKNVKTLKKGAFKNAKACKTLTVNTKKLTKKSVKGSLKGSAVKTVKVPKATKAAYKKIFTKKNAGKKVTVK